MRLFASRFVSAFVPLVLGFVAAGSAGSPRRSWCSTRCTTRW
jgi:hypothetical protein